MGRTRILRQAQDERGVEILRPDCIGAKNGTMKGCQTQFDFLY
jgi:hypothetical protein